MARSTLRTAINGGDSGAGLVLLAVGLLVVQGLWGIFIAVVALVPLLAGIFDVCVFAPLFRAPFKGSAVRDRSDRITS